MSNRLLRAPVFPWMLFAAGALAHEIRPAAVTVSFEAPNYRNGVKGQTGTSPMVPGSRAVIFH